MTTTKTQPTTKPARTWTLSITREELARRIKRKRARLQATVTDLEGACREARAAILAGRPFDAVSYLDDVLRLGRTEEAPPVEAMPEIKPIMADPIGTVVADWPHPARAILDTLMAACGYDTTDSAIEPVASVPTTA